MTELLSPLHHTVKIVVKQIYWEGEAKKSKILQLFREMKNQKKTKVFMICEFAN